MRAGAATEARIAGGRGYFVSDLACRADLAAARACGTIGPLDFPLKDHVMPSRPHGTAWLLLIGLALSGSACAAQSPAVTIRTQSYPRPPYSEATYYVYERDGKVICTKLKICDKYEHCDVDYHAGAFLDPLDQRTGDPYGITAAVPIPKAKRAKHECLAKFVPDAL